MFAEDVAQQLEQNDFSYLHKIIQTEKGKRNEWLTKENIHGYIKASLNFTLPFLSRKNRKAGLTIYNTSQASL